MDEVLIFPLSKASVLIPGVKFRYAKPLALMRATNLMEHMRNESAYFERDDRNRSHSFSMHSLSFR